MRVHFNTDSTQSCNKVGVACLGNVALKVLENDHVSARRLDEELGEHFCNLSGFFLLKEREEFGDDEVNDNNGGEEADDRGECNVKISLGEWNRITEQGVNDLHRDSRLLKQ